MMTGSTLGLPSLRALVVEEAKNYGSEGLPVYEGFSFCEALVGLNWTKLRGFFIILNPWTHVKFPFIGTVRTLFNPRALTPTGID